MRTYLHTARRPASANNMNSDDFNYFHQEGKLTSVHLAWSQCVSHASTETSQVTDMSINSSLFLVSTSASTTPNSV